MSKMPRDFFRKATPGLMSPSGNIITDVQTALVKAGCNGLTVDGRFGAQTQTALQTFQTARGLPLTGTVSDTTWTALMATPEPPIFTRCLQVTGAFEGTGFGGVVGNFDGAGITWGIIGFTLMNGELGVVLARINAGYPGLIANAFGADADTLMQMAGGASTPAQKAAWADSISLGAQKYQVAEPWKTNFRTLGSEPAVQQIEIGRARDLYWATALRDSGDLAMSDELDFLLFFDTAVQNGGLGSKGRLQTIKDAFNTQQPNTELARRRIVAQVIADTSNPKYKQDVLSRKLSISVGRGAIHGDTYDFGDWGLLDGQKPTNPDA